MTIDSNNWTIVESKKYKGHGVTQFDTRLVRKNWNRYRDKHLFNIEFRFIKILNIIGSIAILLAAYMSHNV